MQGWSTPLLNQRQTHVSFFESPNSCCKIFVCVFFLAELIVLISNIKYALRMCSNSEIMSDSEVDWVMTSE